MPKWRIELLASVPPEETSSGLGRVVWELSASLVALGHRVRVLYPADSAAPHPPHKGVEAVPVPTGPTPRRPFGRDIAIGKAARTILDPAADLIVGNDEKAGALGPIGGRGGRGPVFAMFVHDVALHTFDTLRPLEPSRGVRQRVGNWLDRRTLKSLESTALTRARVILVGSALNEELLRKHYEISGDRVRRLPLGVPSPLEVGTKADARQRLHLPLDVPVVAFVGRTPERQGLPVALDAFRRVRVFFPGARFVVVGSSPKTEPGVLALGVVDDETKARALRAADVFLFPARYEGFGLAPREAMGYGLATVMSAHVPLDGIDRKEAVRVVATDDPADYASELAELMADPALRRSIGEAAKECAEGFSFDRMAERFEKVFSPMLPS
ncbi:MAG: glycosyltransferase family 4 protein [Thermoplasmata archaeon]|nr:glycosyltransferase family 4 protein [Thermoplasmata archaeon]